tara:strand:+ start:39 stop:701 length:663 start_codon:yes stop_codon:yes gene_type:complete
MRRPTRRIKDRPVQTKTAADRSGGGGQTRQSRLDDLADAKDKRKLQGVADRKQVFANGALDVKTPPAASVKPPKADKQNISKVEPPKAPTAKKKPEVSKPALTKRPKVTGKGTDMKSRDVTSEGPSGKRTLANVTAEQLKAAGLTGGPKGLRTYLNKFNELGRRPKPSDFKKSTEKKNKATPTSPASARGRGIIRKAGGGKVTIARGSGAARPQNFRKNG